MKQINYKQEPLNHVPRSVIYWVSQGLVIGGNRHSIREFRIEDDKLKLITEFDGKFYEHEINSSGSNSSTEDHGKEQKKEGEFTYDELFKYMIRKTQYNPEELYQTPDMEATVALTNSGDVDDPFIINVVSERDLEYLDFKEIYNFKSEFFENHSKFNRVFGSNINVYHEDTILPYNSTNKSIDLSKLKNKRVFQLVIKPG